jgi:hypothetical protein
MSAVGQEAQSFFNPLIGRTATFVLDGRQANLDFARTVMSLLAQAGSTCAILDLDALYSSNSDHIFSLLAPAEARSSILRIPEPGCDIESELSGLFNATQRVILVDSLNSLYHLISLEDGSSRSRKLTFAVASLSYLARTNAKAVILTMYRREGFPRSGTGRSISGLSDITATVDVRGQELTVRSERGSAWRSVFLTRIP